MDIRLNENVAFTSHTDFMNDNKFMNMYTGNPTQGYVRINLEEYYVRHDETPALEAEEEEEMVEEFHRRRRRRRRKQYCSPSTSRKLEEEEETA